MNCQDKVSSGGRPLAEVVHYQIWAGVAKVDADTLAGFSQERLVGQGTVATIEQDVLRVLFQSIAVGRQKRRPACNGP